MNILFYVSCTPDPHNGGIERVSYVLAQEFNKQGHTCYAAYYMEYSPTFISNVFKDSYYLPINDPNWKQNIQDIINNKQINIVINQLAYIWPLNNILYEIKKEIFFKLFTVHHNNPIANKYLLSDQIYELRKNSIKGFLKYIIYKIYPQLIINHTNKLNHNQLSKDLEHSDFYVYLSHYYVDNVIKEYYITENLHKLKNIPNPLSFKTFFDTNKIQDKQKEILVVGRYDESQKKISRAIKLWKKIESTYGNNGWKLILIGHGKDFSLYKKLITELKISNIELRGRENPEQYYKKASIFLMTSAYEGWPMTIIEAMQNACIPIVYDTFSSIHEILDNGINGYIIKDDNESDYIAKLNTLMNEPERRIQMGKAAINKSKMYEASKIASEWINLFTEHN